MGNHNILITNPRGERRHQFIGGNLSMDECRAWLEEYGPAPIGWMYQIVNLNKKKRRYPDETIILGYNAEGEVVDSRRVRVKHNNGKWYTPRMAKRDARKQGAIWFTKEKIWNSSGPKMDQDA